jgi:putative hydrolase of the HAD superfamily
LRPYRAIFLDRDGVLSRNSPEKARERDLAMGKIIGREDFRITPEINMGAFWRVFDLPGIKPVNTLPREQVFWRKWYQTILEDHGIAQNSEALAAELYERFCFHEMMELFPETRRVLEALKDNGYALGVISDTFPSLQASLESLGIARYFDSFTASSIVGAGKPDPRIFAAATQSLGVEARDSVFVDDTKVEADGAREQGFTSFHLVRQREEPDLASWTLGNLEHLLDFLATRLISIENYRRWP